MLDKIISKLRCLLLPCGENKYRPKILQSRFLYYYAALLLLFKIFTISLFFCLPQTSFFADITKTSLLKLANQARQEIGVGYLSSNPQLDEAALLKAQNMLQDDYFAHTSPSGVAPWFWFSEAGYDYKYAGENLAIGFVDSAEVNQAWLASPSHRQNILSDKYDEIGLAVVAGEFQGARTTIVVQLFGASRDLAAVAMAAQTPEATEIQPSSETLPPDSEATQSNPIAEGPDKEVLSAYTGTTEESGFMVRFLSFLTSEYNDLFQKIIYGSFALIISLLLVTVVIDIFAYRAYEIQYKGIFLKTFILCAIFILLLFIDKETIVSLIPHNLGIY